ncbi:MAG: pyridoxal phosphate-dependent aminotransferase [Bacteroidetes bacterium]|nr:pyridoxal phosphate-dependent aminotransferase [Bacteroidota bacterium]
MTMEVLTERLRNMSESETLAMTRKSRELQCQGFDVINLSIGEPDFNTPDFIKEAAMKAIAENRTHYPPVAGIQVLRQAVSDKLKRDNNLDYRPEQIIISAGAKHSIANAMLSIIGPGDEVLVPAPYWVSYKEIIKLAQGTPVFIETSIDNDFKITPAQLEASITSKTKAIIYSSPCNPSGSVYTRNELKGLAEVLTNYKNIFIISDEIYELINFEGRHESIAQFTCLKDQVILINGVSKGFAMTGWRIGYMAAPDVIAKACDKLQGQFTSGVSTIAQYAAIAALQADPKNTPEIDYMVKTFRERRDYVLDLLAEIPGFKTNKPQGAFYVFINVKEHFGKRIDGKVITNASDLSMYLLEKACVALVPGDAFGNPNCLRLSYATSKELLREAVRRISEAIQKLN